MAQIPMGNFGNAVPQATRTQTVNTDGGLSQARRGLANTVGQVAGELVREQRQADDLLQRTSAGVAYQQHALDLQSTLKSQGEMLSAGQIDQETFTKNMADAKKRSYANTIGALPDTPYREAAAVQVASLNRSVDLNVQESILKNTHQLVLSNASNMLDAAGKAIVLAPDNIDATVASTRQAYELTAAQARVPKQIAEKTAQDWADKQYLGHAQAAMIQARASGDIDAMRSLENNLTDKDGFYAGKMDASQRNQVLSSVVSQRLAMENGQQQALDAKEEDGRKAVNEAIDFLGTGKFMSPEYQQTILARTTGTKYAADAIGLIKESASGSSFATKTIPQQRTELQRYQSAANTPEIGTDPATFAAIKKYEQMHTAKVEAFKSDPWKAAQDYNNIQSIPALDVSSIQGLSATLAQRAKLAPVVEQNAGRAVSLLTPDEASSVLKTLQAAPINQRAQLINVVGAAMGTAGRINDLAKQWQEKDQAVALALKAGAAAGGPLESISTTPISAFILEGQQALKDKTVKVDDLAGSGLEYQIASKINGTLPTEQETDAKNTAYYLAIGAAARNHRTVPSSDDIEKAIDGATGGISKTGGTRFDGTPHQVARPYGWTDDQFQGAVRAASVGNIENTVNGRPIETVYANGQPIPASDFMAKMPSYKLVRVGVRGTYAVQAGSGFVTDATGTPLTIKLNLGQKPQPTTALPMNFEGM